MNNWSASRSTNFLANEYFLWRSHNQQPIVAKRRTKKTGIFFSPYNLSVGKRWSFCCVSSIDISRKRALTFFFFVSSQKWHFSRFNYYLVAITFSFVQSIRQQIASHSIQWEYIFKWLSSQLYLRRFPFRSFIPSFVSMNVLIKKYLARVHFRAPKSDEGGPN